MAIRKEDVMRAMNWFEFAVFIVKALMELGIWLKGTIEDAYKRVEYRAVETAARTGRTLSSQEKRVTFKEIVTHRFNDAVRDVPDDDRMRDLVEIAWRISNPRRLAPREKIAMALGKGERGRMFAKLADMDLGEV